ncbi:MAG: hypothetical protein L6R41_000185 [Letrouitia leprolyta]|nr:MAG: hypothetical protein L6R41_000185 [Letrouitia leprolyta]
MSGNAWVNNDRGSREALQPAQEHHVPVNGFNSQEARNALKDGFNSENKKVASYKSSSQAQGVKSGSPWASKANTMGNNKDFFLELRKQLTSIQQHGSERAGG